MSEKKPRPLGEMIERLSLDALKELKAGNQEVDISLLVEYVDSYCNSDEYNEVDANTWANRLDEISLLYHQNVQKIEIQIGNIRASSPKIKAYNKTMNLIAEKD